MNRFKMLKSRTFWGSLIIAVAHAVRNAKPDDPNVQLGGAIAEGVGGVLAGAGLRSAVAKNGRGQ